MRHRFEVVAIAAAAAASFWSPASAGFDEAQQNSFWSSRSAVPHQGPYLTIEPRDAKVAPAENAADANNPYFNHAEGTMSGPAVAAPATPADGRYTATYRQPFMTVEPRDMTIAPRSGPDTNDPYFYHAMGTMGRP